MRGIQTQQGVQVRVDHCLTYELRSKWLQIALSSIALSLALKSVVDRVATEMMLPVPIALARVILKLLFN